MNLIYLDNAATSWPKPGEVALAMSRFMEESAGNPGRAGHRLSIEAGRMVESTREAVCELFGFTDPLRVVFGANATFGLNLAIVGLLKKGDHVITSSVEHNSVMRPLRALEAEGTIDLTVVGCTKEGELPVEDVEAAVKPETKLVVINHGSNVVGTLLPIAAVGQVVRKHDLLLLVDAASTAGAIPIDMERDFIDLLAFTGHKSLLGPTGTGGLVVGERVRMDGFAPLIRGGTGSRSELEVQPEMLPDAFESGTLNAVGLAGLLAGIEWIQERSVEAIRIHHMALTRRLHDGFRGIRRVKVFGTGDPERQTATLAFTVDGMSASKVGSVLDFEHNILCRVGLHCSPGAHKTIGTFPHGTIRCAPGSFTTEEDIDRVISAVSQISKSV